MKVKICPIRSMNGSSCGCLEAFCHFWVLGDIGHCGLISEQDWCRSHATTVVKCGDNCTCTMNEAADEDRGE